MTESINYVPLSRLPLGVTATITDIRDSDVSTRLRELGFIAGETVECVCRSPLGGMRAYRISQSITALRDGDAELITATYEG